MFSRYPFLALSVALFNSFLSLRQFFLPSSVLDTYFQQIHTIHTFYTSYVSDIALIMAPYFIIICIGTVTEFPISIYFGFLNTHKFVSTWPAVCSYAVIYEMIYLTAIGQPPGGSCSVHMYIQTKQGTSQNKQYIGHKNTQNNTKNTQSNTTTRKSAGRAPSLRVLPWHLPYN